MLKIGTERILFSTASGFEVFVTEFALVDLQEFINLIPSLGVNQPFYFGMWRVVLVRADNIVRLLEWDYTRSEFILDIGRSFCLWHEQARVCASQQQLWTSVPQDALVQHTPNALWAKAGEKMEGVRHEQNDGYSGWVLYTDSDRRNNSPIIATPLQNLLAEFNMPLIRFLGLPLGWMFHIDELGSTYTWKSDFSEPTIQ